VSVLSWFKTWVVRVSRELDALWIAARDPRVPWYAKASALVTVAYTFSPIDLIPESVPFGYLADLIIIPLGMFLSVRLIPVGLMKEFRQEAMRRERRPTSYVRMALFALIAIAAAVFMTWLRWPPGMEHGGIETPQAPMVAINLRVGPDAN